MHSPTNYKANLEIGPSLICLTDKQTHARTHAHTHRQILCCNHRNTILSPPLFHSIWFHLKMQRQFAIPCFATTYCLPMPKLFCILLYITEWIEKFGMCAIANSKIMQTLLIDFYYAFKTSSLLAMLNVYFTWSFLEIVFIICCINWTLLYALKSRMYCLGQLDYIMFMFTKCKTHNDFLACNCLQLLI